MATYLDNNIDSKFSHKCDRRYFEKEKKSHKTKIIFMCI